MLNRIHRILAALLTLTLLITGLPMAAFAEEAVPEALPELILEAAEEAAPAEEPAEEPAVIEEAGEAAEIPEPAAIEEVAAAEEPVFTEEPAAEEPAEEPAVTGEPVISEETETTEEPVTTEEPAAGAEAEATPEVTPEPVVSEEPAATEVPATTEVPAVIETPAPEAAESPAAAELPLGEDAIEDEKMEAVVNNYFVVEEGVLTGYTGYSSIIFVPDGVTAIADSVFEDYPYMLRLVLPESLVSIGNKAFAGCEKLVDVSLPSKLEEIGREAFEGCKELQKISIPGSVKEIGDYAFLNCEKLMVYIERGCIAAENHCLINGLNARYTDGSQLEGVIRPTATVKPEETVKPDITAAPTSTATATPAPTQEPETPVYGLSLNCAELTVGVKEKFQLEASVYPESDVEITYASANSKIASVSKTGAVTGKKAGETVITVTAGDMTAQCSVKVVKAPSKIKLSKTSLTMGAGQLYELGATLNNGNEARVKYTTSSKKVVTVDANGVLTAVGKGSARITVSSYNGLKAACKVTVSAAPKSVELDITEVTLPVAMTFKMEPSVNKGSYAGFFFESSDESVASVDENGLITAVSIGEAVVTATTYNGLQVQCSVSVTPAPTAVSLNATSAELGVGEKLQLEASADFGGDAGLSYKSSNSRAATVSKMGVVTAKKAGSAVIRVSAFNGVYADCNVTVKAAPSSIKLSEKKLVLNVGDASRLEYSLSSKSAGSVRFASSDESIVTVDEQGNISAVAPGTAKIKATTYNGKTATCTVSVITGEYMVSGLQRDGKKITATATTVDACLLRVEVWNEAGRKQLAGFEAKAEAGLNLGQVEVSAKYSFPKSFILKAQLLDKSGNPLSAVYTTKRYTSAYQDFENQSPEDFPADRVLDFGEAGYAVLNKDVIVIEDGFKKDGDKYILPEGTNVQSGDVLYMDGSFLKVNTVETTATGSIVTVLVVKLIKDVLDVLDVDIYIDFGTVEKGLEGVFGSEADFKMMRMQIENKEIVDNVFFSSDTRGYLRLKFIYDQQRFGPSYVDSEVYVYVDGKASVTIGSGYAGSFDIPIADFPLPGLPVVAHGDVEFTIPMSLTANAGGTVETTFTAKKGFSYTPDTGTKEIDELIFGDPIFKIGGGFEGRIGAQISVGVTFFEDMLRASLGGELGMDADGELVLFSTDSGLSEDKTSQHACTSCVDINLSPYISFPASLTLGSDELVGVDLVDLELTDDELLHWHYSLVNEAESVYKGAPEFGKGKCPNNKYQTIIGAADWSGKDLIGIPLDVVRKDLSSASPVPSGSSEYELYLYPGSYLATGTFESGEAEEEFFVGSHAMKLYVQEEAAYVEGYVRENNEENPGSGKAISGASVKVSLENGESLSTTTDSKGFYKFDRLPAGEIHFEFSASGYESSSYSMRYKPGTRNQANASLVKLNNFPLITALGSSSGSYQLLPADGKTDGIPKVMLNVSSELWGGWQNEVQKATLVYEGAALPFEYRPSKITIGSVRATGLNMGNDDYTFIFEAFAAGTIGGSEIYVLQVKNGKLSKVKEYTLDERSDDIDAVGKFTSKTKYNITLKPTGTKFKGAIKSDSYNRTGKEIWESGTGYMSYELMDDGYYDLLFSTIERCEFNADVIGNSYTRYSMENGKIKLTEQWFDGPAEALPTLSATLTKKGSVQLSPASGSSDGIPKVTMTTTTNNMPSANLASVTLKHEDAKKNWTLDLLVTYRVDLTAVDMGNGEYTYVLETWNGGTGGGANVIVLRVKDGSWNVVKDFTKASEIDVVGKFSDGRHYSLTMYPSGKTFSGVQEHNIDMRKGTGLISHPGEVEYQENEDGGYDIIYINSIRGNVNIDFVGALNNRYALKNGKFTLVEQWFTPDYEPIVPISAEVTRKKSAELKAVGSVSANVPKVTLSASDGGSVYIGTVTVSHEDASEAFTYKSSACYKAKLFAVDAGSGSYTYALQCLDLDENAVVILFTLKDGKWVTLKDFSKDSAIRVTGSFSTDEDYSGVLYPKGVKFSGYAEQGYYHKDRAGSELLCKEKGALTYEEDSEGNFSLVYKTPIFYGKSTALKAYNCLRYRVESGKLVLKQQWFEEAAS